MSLTEKKEETSIKLLYINDVAKFLGVGYHSVRAFIKNKKLNSVMRKGREPLFDREEVLALKKEREKKKEDILKYEKKYFTQAQIAEILGVSFRTVRAFYNSKQFSYVETPFKTMFFDKDVIAAFKEKRDEKLKEKIAEKKRKEKEDKNVKFLKKEARKVKVKELTFSMPRKQRRFHLSLDRKKLVSDPYYGRNVDFDYEVYQENKKIGELETQLRRLENKSIMERKSVRLRLIHSVGKRRQKLNFLKSVRFESYKNTIKKIGLEQ